MQHHACQGREADLIKRTLLPLLALALCSSAQADIRSGFEQQQIDRVNERLQCQDALRSAYKHNQLFNESRSYFFVQRGSVFGEDISPGILKGGGPCKTRLLGYTSKQSCKREAEKFDNTTYYTKYCTKFFVEKGDLVMYRHILHEWNGKEKFSRYVYGSLATKYELEDALRRTNPYR